MALTSAFGLVACRLVFFSSGSAKHVDGAVLIAFARFGATRLSTVASAIMSSAGLAPVAIVATVLVTGALTRGRYRSALAIVVIVLAANGLTELLKALVAPPRVLIPQPSWPSGHATAAMSLTLAALIASPPRLRRAIATGGGVITIAVGYSVLKLENHYMSDVLAGYLVAAFVTGIVIASRSMHGGQHGSRGVPQAWPRISLACLLVGIVLVCGMIVEAPQSAADGLNDPSLMAAGAVTIAVVAAAIIGAVTTLLASERPTTIRTSCLRVASRGAGTRKSRRRSTVL